MVRPTLNLSNDPTKALVIAGATGSGKSALALDLAEKLNGEIICADSRQFYKFMHIGTASPEPKELSRAVHHAFNDLDPRFEKMCAGRFVRFANACAKSIQARNKKPIFVGGTGLYLRALRYGFADVPKSCEKKVLALENECDERGLAVLYQELIAADPALDGLIYKTDRYRILRNLEIWRSTGTKPSFLRTSFAALEPQFNADWILVSKEKATRHEDLEKRAKSMLTNGLIEEAESLAKLLPENHWALDVMGYKEALGLAHGTLSRAQAEELIFIQHRQYAKRQITWFKKERFYQEWSF
jgi:tRNA dimethylallyltransferase